MSDAHIVLGLNGHQEIFETNDCTSDFRRIRHPLPGWDRLNLCILRSKGSLDWFIVHVIRYDAADFNMDHVFNIGMGYQASKQRMSFNTQVKQVGDIILRERLAQGGGEHKLLVMLHGLTGDENSMWVFESRIPEYYRVISPRGLWETPVGGYGWREDIGVEHRRVEDFQPAINALNELISSVTNSYLDQQTFSLMGFSEGAALSYSMAIRFPERIDKLAGLSGFLPDDIPSSVPPGLMHGKKIYVAHGKNDELVGIEEARKVVDFFQQAGVEVAYCEEDIGHKLSAGCFRGLGEYFRDPNYK